MRGLPFSEYSVISSTATRATRVAIAFAPGPELPPQMNLILWPCLLYTSDAADE